MCEYRSLTFEEQIDLFIQRGMQVSDKTKDSKKLQYINYYKLKELAYPFYKQTAEGEYKYQNISFDELLKRYYQDKHIRLAMLSCIEKIEIAFKTRFCHLLGKKHGAYGYLQFNNWCNKEKYCKYYISEKQGDFKNRIKENQYLYHKTKCIENFLLQNKDSEKIPIWMLVEVLTFGEILYLFGIMSTENQKHIANDFNCQINEFISWLKSLNFIRNQCAHNSNIINIKLKTKPLLRHDWKELLTIDKNNQSSGRLADIIIPMVFLTIIINKKYAFNDLQRAISKLVENSDERANMLGFKDVHTANTAIKYLGGNFKYKKNKPI
ncbi:hypothetical protein E4N83_02365 [Treponema denticola]|uniref:Abortive infection bacteriophage resistance protein n=1 Tax=Treponema denticola H-22 TaxID=999432 RepID=A0A0E2E7D0_TREDN|nr:Abi family protein [Treponema denticola]EGC78155.1 hypothetical protein HMPREF9353_01002 [Treponema denticola F0402]EMB34237.1 hypothetical protein HMPREF9726_00986 [Treponema denticola H-22]UTC97153.1 hypothetical protein E4N83_02365 [Treponema denticola]UTD06889.1 Abi family protein [Treponema denticola]